jgi:hypothetical protein
MAEYGMETFTVTQKEKVLKPAICRKIDTVFVDSKAQCWNIIRRGAHQ